MELRLSYNAFYWIGKLIREEFENVFATLEGGYNIEHLPACLYNFVAGFNGEEQPYHESHTETAIMVRDEYEWSAAELESKLTPYWDI